LRSDNVILHGPLLAEATGSATATATATATDFKNSHGSTLLCFTPSREL
jgi:hypothetical protein